MEGPPGSIQHSINTKKQRNEILLKILFGFLAVMGQVSQNISLPLWMDAGTQLYPNCTNETNTNNVNESCIYKSMDAYFVFSFTTIWFWIIFSIILIIQMIVKPGSVTKKDLKFPPKNLIFVGFFYALNGALVVFASSPKRTPPYLQAILGNFIIPWTVLFRLIMLRKRPSLIKGLCATAVALSLFLCIMPNIVPSLGADTQTTESTIDLIVWPMIFMIGFTPLAMVNVLEEKILKDERQINLLFFLFCLTSSQLTTCLSLFWLDILPWYGNAKSMSEMLDNWGYGISCFFGGSGCNGDAGVRGTIFISGCIFMYYGSAMLVRYAEGAVLLAVVTSLVTPIGFLFWSLFQDSPFEFHPEANNSTWFAIAALCIMIPAIFIYNYESPKKQKDDEQQILSNDHSEIY